MVNDKGENLSQDELFKQGIALLTQAIGYFMELEAPEMVILTYMLNSLYKSIMALFSNNLMMLKL